MEKEYHKALEVIFSYGYGCYVFKHSICEDRLEVLDGMPNSTDPLPLGFFANPGCPPVQAAPEANATEVTLNEAAKEPMEIAAAEDHGIL